MMKPGHKMKLGAAAAELETVSALRTGKEFSSKGDNSVASDWLLHKHDFEC